MEKKEYTREQRVAELGEKTAKLDDLVKEWNAAMQAEDFKALKDAETAMAVQEKECQKDAMNLAFFDLAQTADPMLEAVKQLTYTTFRVKEVQGDSDPFPVRVVETVQKPIDLTKLHKYVDGGIGARKDWMDLAQKVNFLLTAKVAQDIGVSAARMKEINDSYAMSNIAQAIDMGRTPTSNTNILKTVQSVVDGMLGEGHKAVSHDVRYLLYTYGKKGKGALKVACAKHNAFIALMAEVCHRIVTGGTYDVDFKAKK